MDTNQPTTRCCLPVLGPSINNLTGISYRFKRQKRRQFQALSYFFLLMFLRFNANHILPKYLYKMIIYNHFLSLTSLHIVGGLTIITSAASNKRSERRNSRPRFTLCCIPPVKIGHEWKVMVSHHYNQLQFVTIIEN